MIISSFSSNSQWIVKVLVSHLGNKKPEYLYFVYLFSILQYITSNPKKIASDKFLGFLQQCPFLPKCTVKSECKKPLY